MTNERQITILGLNGKNLVEDKTPPTPVEILSYLLSDLTEMEIHVVIAAVGNYTKMIIDCPVSAEKPLEESMLSFREACSSIKQRYDSIFN